MGYVKGCDFSIVSKTWIKKFESSKALIEDGFMNTLPLDKLKEMFEEVSKDFTDISGNVRKGVPSGHIYIMTKKIDKKRILLGAASIKRIAGEPIEGSGLQKMFSDSTDSYVLGERFFAEGYEKEEEYFDECVISHLRDAVGMGQVKTADYQDKIIEKVEKKNIGGVWIGRTAYFIGMWFLWGFIFKNWGLGLCFAFMFLTSFTMITAKSTSKETSKEGMNGEVSTEVSDMAADKTE